MKRPDPSYIHIPARPRSLLTRLRYRLWRWADNLAAGEEGAEKIPRYTMLVSEKDAEAIRKWNEAMGGKGLPYTFAVTKPVRDNRSRRVAAWLVAVAVGMALCAGVVGWAVMR